MKKCKLLILVLITLVLASCGKGTETGTPHPLENVSLELMAANGSKYIMSLGGGGQGTVYQLDEEDIVVDEKDVTVLVDLDYTFDVTVTFDDQTAVTFSGIVDEFDTIIEMSITINGQVYDVDFTLIDPSVISALYIGAEVDTEMGTNGDAADFSETNDTPTDGGTDEDPGEGDGESGGEDGGGGGGGGGGDDSQAGNKDDIWLLPELNLTTDTAYSAPSIAFNGESYAVIYRGARGLYFTQIDTHGNVTINPFLAINASNCRNFSFIWNGEGYGVVWDGKIRTSSNSIIFFAELDSKGNLKAQPKSITLGINDSINPSIAWARDRYGIFWNSKQEEQYELHYTSVNSSGDVIFNDVAIHATNSTRKPSVIFTGSYFAVAWQADSIGARNRIIFANIDKAGTIVRTTNTVASSSNHQSAPEMIATDDGFAVLWSEDDSGVNKRSHTLHLANITSEGEIVSTALLDLSGMYNYSIASNGEYYAIIYNDDDSNGTVGVELAIVEPQGNIKHQPITIAESGLASGRSIVWTGHSYGFVYGVGDEFSSGNRYDIFFQRLSLEAPNNGSTN